MYQLKKKQIEYFFLFFWADILFSKNHTNYEIKY